jgi:hypothetical protein
VVGWDAGGSAIIGARVLVRPAWHWDWTSEHVYGAAAPDPYAPKSGLPTPYTLHPTLCTLHPAPCTLHPAPCTQTLRRSSLVCVDACSLPSLIPKTSTLNPQRYTSPGIGRIVRVHQDPEDLLDDGYGALVDGLDPMEEYKFAVILTNSAGASHRSRSSKAIMTTFSAHIELAILGPLHSTLHPKSHILHPTPYALRPTPYTLHLAYCNLLPTPQYLAPPPPHPCPTPASPRPHPRPTHPDPRLTLA